MTYTASNKYMERAIRHTVLSVLAALLLPATAAAQQYGAQPSPGPEASMGMVLGVIAVGFLVMLAISAAVIHLATEFARSSVGYITNEPGDTGVIGFVVIIGGVIAAVVGILVVGGLSAAFPPLALLGVVFGLIVFALALLMIPAQIGADIAVGFGILDALEDRRGSELDTKGLWVSLIVGVAVLTVINFIPIVGFLVGIAVSSLGVGALIRYWRDGPYEWSDGGEGWDDTPGAAGGDGWDDTSGATGGEWGTDGTQDRGAADEFGAQRDQRDQWGEGNSSKRDDSEEFW